jgi:EAL domain-containing protein (putative c-di-GMP-specific phosphodiesterase class I)
VPRVLITDDDPLVRGAVERILARAGHQVTAAGDARAAIACLDRGERFDVVVSDIMMPDLSGIDLLREIRKRDLDVPVILVTGVPELSTAMAAVDLGAFRYLPKPFDVKELVRTVERAARMHQLALAKREALALGGRDDSLLGDRASLEGRFQSALDQLWMAFQPIVSVSERRVLAYEALLRTEEPALKNPMAFIAAAEKLGRIFDLGRKVRAAVADAVANDPGAPPAAVDIFVNLHPRDLLDPELVDAGAPLTKIAPRVVLEITERASLDDISDVAGRIATLRAFGYRIALDDLGAGYAGLTSMTTLSPDVVKLDMSLVRGIDGDERRRTVVGSLASLCTELSMSVVVEGIENERERDAVRGLGPEQMMMQGYHFARPQRGFATIADAAWL